MVLCLMYPTHSLIQGCEYNMGVCGACIKLWFNQSLTEGLAVFSAF